MISYQSIAYIHMIENITKKGSTHFLRAAIVVMGLIVLALCIFALPSMYNGASAEFPYASLSVLLIIIGMYATAIPFYIALWQTLKLLKLIDTKNAFSDAAVRTLRNIKRCATMIAVLYLGGVPLLFPIADADDAPGLLVIGFVIACAPVVVAVFAAVLQKLLQSVLDIKSENDLTV